MKFHGIGKEVSISQLNEKLKRNIQDNEGFTDALFLFTENMTTVNSNQLLGEVYD